MGFCFQKKNVVRIAHVKMKYISSLEGAMLGVGYANKQRAAHVHTYEGEKDPSEFVAIFTKRVWIQSIVVEIRP